MPLEVAPTSPYNETTMHKITMVQRLERSMTRTYEKYDLAGKKIGCFEVIEKASVSEHGMTLWRCKCTACGTIKDNLRTYDLNTKLKDSTSCGKACESRQIAKQYIGHKFHNLTVTEINEELSALRATIYVNTVCTCGAPRPGVKLTDLKCKTDRKWACSKACESTTSAQSFVGQRFGKFTITNVRHGTRKDTEKDANRVIFDAKCDCGCTVSYPKRLFTGENGHRTLKSCGCEKLQRMKDICKDKWDGHTPIPQARATPEYFAWRKKVYKKYVGTCVCCGSKNRKGMEAHHLFGFSFFQHLKYDENNGILLCENCHKEFHRKNGNHFNVPQQMLTFLGRSDLPGVDLDRLLAAGEPTITGPLEDVPQVDEDIGD